MKERMIGIGGNGNDFEGKPDDGSGTAGLKIPKQCKGCPYVEGVASEHAAVVGLEEQRKDDAHGFAGIATKALRMPRRAGQSSAEVGSIVDEVSADVGEEIKKATEEAQRIIDEITADCRGVSTDIKDQNNGDVIESIACNSPVLGDGEKDAGKVVDRYNTNKAQQAVLALRASLLPDNDDGGEEGEYVTPLHWIEEVRGADDDDES